MINHIVIVGRLGKAPEMAYSRDGNAVTKFSVATDDGFGERRATTWHNVVVFKAAAEACAKYLDKGSLVAVVGRQTHRQYDSQQGKRYWSEIVAERVQFLDSKSGEAREEPERGEDIDQDNLDF